MSDSPQKRSVDDVAAPEVVEASKRSKAEDKDAPAVQESALGGESGDAEAGPSDEKEVNEDEIDEDELAALDEANIISGPRTRGKKIDFRKASEEAGGEEEDDEEDADVTANTTMPKSDEESDDDDEEDVEADAKDNSDIKED